LQESFRQLDKNADGRLSKQEMIEGYKRIYPEMTKEQIETEVERVFEVADQDGNGELDYSEWQVASINKYSILQEQKLREAFKLFDRDGSGEITASEIKAILGSGKKMANEGIFDDIIKEVDVNGDGVISFEEFKQMMQKLFNDPS
jgi:calcium-dependent protein kinase